MTQTPGSRLCVTERSRRFVPIQRSRILLSFSATTTKAVPGSCIQIIIMRTSERTASRQIQRRKTKTKQSEIVRKITQIICFNDGESFHFIHSLVYRVEYNKAADIIKSSVHHHTTYLFFHFLHIDPIGRTDTDRLKVIHFGKR